MNYKTISQNLIALASFLAYGGISQLAAQNTNSLDSAPGVNSSAVKAPVAPAAPAPIAKATGPSLLSNGDFQSATKDPAWPDNWGKGKGITWETENGKHFLRLVSQQPGQMLMAYREMAIPAGVKGIEISFRYRTANVKKGVQLWFDARSIFHVMDAAKQSLKPEPKPLIFSSKAANWTEASVRAVLPPEAATLVLMPSLFQAASGTLDLAEIRVVALDEAAVGVIASNAAAAAQKQAGESAILEKQLALAAKSTELKVSGNKLVTTGGKTVLLQGVNIESLEWSATGESVLWSAWVAMNEWHANALRLPVNDDIWFGRGKGGAAPNDAEAYRKIVDKVIQLAATQNAYVILDLHRFLAPTDQNVDFWKDAAARYKNNPAVIFDIFNEPHGISWEIWRNGGTVEEKQKQTSFHSPGMQALVEAVRGTGAKNIIVAGGLGYSFDLTGIETGFALEDKTGNGIMYATHFYNWHKGWEKHFLMLADKYPLLVGETGADINKMSFIPANAQEDPYTWVPDALGMIQKYKLNWTAFSFHPKSTPVLLSDWNYTPTPFWGAFVKDALNGKKFEMKRLR